MLCATHKILPSPVSDSCGGLTAICGSICRGDEHNAQGNHGQKAMAATAAAAAHNSIVGSVMPSHKRICMVVAASDNQAWQAWLRRLQALNPSPHFPNVWACPAVGYYTCTYPPPAPAPKAFNNKCCCWSEQHSVAPSGHHNNNTALCTQHVHG